MNELFDRVAVSLFEFSMLKAEATKKSFGVETKEGYKEKSFVPTAAPPTQPPAQNATCCT